jgi:hypothetical protein
MLFIRVAPISSAYSALPRNEPEDHNGFRWSHQGNPTEHRAPHSDEPGTQSTTPQAQSPTPGRPPLGLPNSGLAGNEIDVDETSPLTSQPILPRDPGDTFYEGQLPADISYNSHYSDLRGLALLPKVEFWQLFLTMGLLSGIGLMTIKFVSHVFPLHFSLACTICCDAQTNSPIVILAVP